MKDKAYHTGLTARIREAARKLKEFSSATIMNALNIKTYKEAEHIRLTIKEMRKSGEIENVKEAFYRYVHETRHGRTYEVLNRIYRAIHVKGLFSAADIILLTEADKRYVYRTIYALLEAGDIETAGIRKNIVNRKEALFRVRHKDDFYLKFITQKDQNGITSKKDRKQG